MISYKIRSLLVFTCLQMIFGLAFYYMGRSATNITEDACKLRYTCTSLFDIGMKHATDKVYAHHYDNLYEKYLPRYRNTAVRLLEIGLDVEWSEESVHQLKLGENTSVLKLTYIFWSLMKPAVEDGTPK